MSVDKLVTDILGEQPTVKDRALRELIDARMKKGGEVKMGKGGAIKSLVKAIGKELPEAKASQKTQIPGTEPTYRKAYDILEREKPGGRTLDYGAGLGHGSRLMGAESFEPFPREGFKPDFIRPEDIPTEEFDRLVNLNVLNVMPREMRDATVENIGRVMRPGGMGIVTTRGRDVLNAAGEAGPEPMSKITSIGTYQKGFSPEELREYLKYMLGEGYDISRLNLGPAGAVVRKKGNGMKRGGRVKGETLATMDTGKVEMRKAPGAAKAEEALSALSELVPGVGAAKAAAAGDYPSAALQGALDVAGGPLLKGVAALGGKAIPALAGIFIGPKSKLWNAEKVEEWGRLINAGVDEKEAYQKTGTFMGADGNLRQEISDQSMKMRSPEDLARLMDEKSRQAQAIKASMGYGSKQRDLFPKELTEARKREKPRLESLEADIRDLERDPEALGVPARLAVDHPKLFEAYPELGDVMVRQNVDLGPGVYGSASLGVEPKISLADPRFLDKEFAAPEDTMIHELQHLVQRAEGFEGGASAQDAMNMVGRARVRELMDQGMPKNEALDQAREEFKGRAGELYNRMAGEAEARAVEARRPMSQEDLLQNFPPEQQYRDFYPYEEQLMQRDYPPVLLYAKGGEVKKADGGAIGKNVGRGMAGLRRSREPLDPKEIQAMMLDVPAGVGIPFAEAGAEYLRGNVEDAETSAAIDAALTAVPVVGALAKPAYRAVKSGVKKAAPAVREAARGALESAMESGLVQGPSYAVKPTGGQWLGGYKGDSRQIDVSNAPAGTSEDVVQAYRDRLEDAERRAREYTEMSGFEPTQAITDQVRGLRSNVDRIEQENAVRRWVDSNLNNYVRKQMGTPDDPVLKLAEQGILHMPYQETSVLKGLAEQREKAGFPAEGLATTDLGRMWETMSDRNIASIEAGKLTDPNYLKDLERRARENDPLFNSRPSRMDDEPPPTVMTPAEARDLRRFKYMNYPPARANVMEENQWLSRVDPETPIYSISGPFGDQTSGRDLGFDHIVDVLKADLAAGRIRPEQLSKMSMEQAVRRTHEYDLERAAAMAKALEEETANLSVAKSFDDGFKIVQLDKPGQFAKESDRMGHSVRGYEPPRQSEDWTEASGVEGSQFYGHGGWDAIKSGEAQVFSIRDAKNQPHVTIEVAKPRPTFAEMKGMLEDRGYDENEVIEQLFKRGYLDKSGNPVPDKPMRITQIKGKQNRKPDDDYLPYVQQFIREGNYVIAGDIRNSGLIDIDTARSWDHGFPDKYVSLRDALPANAPRYVTESELDHVRKTGKFEPKFKEGGAVQKYAKGGVVKNLIKKASEALGEHEGRSLMVTQSDRTKVGGKFLGGPGFSSLQLTDPLYKEAEAVWGVGKKGAATKMINAARKLPEGKAIWSTMIGSPEQHKSNQQVFDELLNKFRSSAKEGNLDPDLQARINAKLAEAVDKEGKPLFPENVDILSPKFRRLADTFDRRAIAADAMAGVQLGGKKGQIIDYSGIIERTTDPLLIGQPTHAIGPRLFELQGDVIERPDLHPAYPFILTGQDLGAQFEPVPRDIMLRDFVEGIRQSKGREPGFMDLTRNTPSQFLSEEFLTGLQKSGYKKGGAVGKGALPKKRA